MKKFSTVTLTIIICVFAVLSYAYLLDKNEEYIDTVTSDLNVALDENDKLEHELAKVKDDLMISNWKLEQIKVKQEGIEYQGEIE